MDIEEKARRRGLDSSGSE